MNITINCDASFNKPIAGYAHWIDTPSGIIRGMGLIEEPVTTASMAELYSFQRAYQRLLEHYGDNVEFNITVFCDNMWVVHGINGNIKTYDVTRKLHVAIAKSIFRDLKPHRVQAFHVKAHAPKITTPEQIANNWCDFNSREIVRKEITRLNGTRIKT